MLNFIYSENRKPQRHFYAICGLTLNTNELKTFFLISSLSLSLTLVIYPLEAGSREPFHELAQNCQNHFELTHMFATAP